MTVARSHLCVEDFDGFKDARGEKFVEVCNEFGIAPVNGLTSFSNEFSSKIARLRHHGFSVVDYVVICYD